MPNSYKDNSVIFARKHAKNLADIEFSKENKDVFWKHCHIFFDPILTHFYLSGFKK